MTDAEREDSAEFDVPFEVSVPQLDLFARDHPAIDEGPKSAWELARTVIDFACGLIGTQGTLRGGREIRDAVLAALLRRATVTVEASYQLLARGLFEPACSVRRTLLDLDLHLNLVHRDATDRMAKRLAAYHYYAYQQHGEDMLTNRETREGILSEAERVPEIIEVARGYARMLGTDIFDDVRADVQTSRYWHGYESAEQALTAIARVSDYHMTYDLATWFVHAVNVDHDFKPRDDQELHLRPMVERDPRVIQTFLGDLILSFLQMLRVYVDERGLPENPDFVRHLGMRSGDGQEHAMDPVAALMAWAVAEWPRSKRESSGGAA